MATLAQVAAPLPPAAAIRLADIGKQKQGRWQDRYALPNWRSMLTKLSPKEEAAFQQWVAATHAPITNDYDMRGFWKAGGATSINPNDGLPHYSDTFKTPLHQSFSGESRYANPTASPPMWNERDQLVLPNGTILFDERAPR